MNISNKELELLLEIENYLLNNTKDINIYLRLHNLNNRLLQLKAIRNEKAKNRVAIKRQYNKMYARSKREILQHERAIAKKEVK
ncbi:MAG: hypothetical protein MST00_06615 [Tenericutes bacterium]|nr:hypothetical protein [Mycoplasmatota bacterium]